MQPPGHLSVSPLFSCTPPTGYVLSFGETLRRVVAWLRGVEPGWRQVSREAEVVDLMADLMVAEVDETEAADHGGR